MKIKKSFGSHVFDICNTLFMILLMIIMLYPFWHVVMASFSSPAKMASHAGLLLWPDGNSMVAYKFVLNNKLIWSGYLNTLFVVGVGTSLNLLMTLMGAYVLSRRKLMFRKLITIMIVFTMYFSGGLIPSFILINNNLHMQNSIWSLIIPGLINTHNMLIMRTAFMTLPESIEESAQLDGANDFICLFRILVPMIKATIAVIVLYYAVGHWNAWFNANLYLKDRTKWPLQLVLRQIIIQSNVTDMVDANDPDQQSLGETIKYATIVVATVPILCVYPFLQRYFVKGVMIGAVKG